MNRFASIASLALTLAVAAPAAAQRSPTGTTTTTRETTTTTATRSTPDMDASAALRAGEPAATAARALVATYRLASADVAGALIRAGYEPGPVGAALSTELRVAPEVAWTDLSRAGVADDRLFGAMIQMQMEESKALALLREQIGSQRAVAIIQKSDALESSEEEIAAAMDGAGYSLEEIIEVLSSAPHSMSADEILALFLELNLASPDDAAMYGWLREKGLPARDAATAMAGDVAAGSQAVILHAGGYAWTEIADALSWLGHQAEDVVAYLEQAGAPLEDAVAWLMDQTDMTSEEIITTVQQAYGDAAGAAAELLERGAEVVDVTGALIQSIMTIAQVVQFLLDQGVAAADIVEALVELGVDQLTIIQVMSSVAGMAHDSILAIISNMRA